MTSSSLAFPLPLSLPSPLPIAVKESDKKIHKFSRIRRRPVTFGNPALGTYEGVVFTLEDLRNEAFDDLLLPVDIASSAGSSPSMDCVAAMIHVPPEQVPEGVLHLARAHQRHIKHARILISSVSDGDDELVGGSVSASEATAPAVVKPTPPSMLTAKPTPLAGTWKRSKSELIDTHHSPLLSTTERRSSSCDDVVVPSPSASAAQSAAAIFAADPSPQLMNSDQQPSRNRAFWKNELNSNNPVLPHRSYLVLFVMSSPYAARQFVHDLNNKPYTTLDETQVAQVHHVVGLEGDAQHGIVSLLSPTFGAAADSRNRDNEDVSKASLLATSSAARGSKTNNYPTLEEEDGTIGTPEVHNCAVCLDPLDQDSDEPGVLITTVCNHSFHWACLWRCKDSPCPVCRYDHAGLNEALSQCHICGTTEHNYVCLICGVISCTNSNTATRSGNATASSLGHARQHYDDTLHAYALDTETQHVWDFCGQGYVHRLLQNSSDGKLVEVSNQDDNQRLPEAGHLSDAQEDEVVHRKLEGFAQQYYTLLKSQLEEQRAYYEGQLEELLQGIKESQFRSSSISSSSSETLIAALKQERRQLQHRLSTLQDRYQKVADEVSFLKNLNESLETNKEQMRRQIQEAQRERNEAQEMIQQSLPPLELKVHALMLQLEQQEGEGDLDLKMAAK